jgi:hypothetical protein
MFKKIHALSKAVLSRTILRNLILICSMSIMLLSISSLSGHAILRSFWCEPTSCEDIGWDAYVEVIGEGECDWDDNEWYVRAEAWVYYVCDETGEDPTENHAEAGDTDYGIDATAISRWPYVTVYYIDVWAYCDSYNGQQGQNLGCGTRL